MMTWRPTFAHQKKLPVIRVDNWLLFPGGKSRKMTWRERLAARRGTLRVRD